MSKSQTKQSYTVPCSSRFRDAVTALAESKGVNAADLARSVIILTPKSQIEAQDDPGGPGRDDRETVVLQSGPQAGKPWRRKPRLQLRLPAGVDSVTIRKALHLALLIEAGDRHIGLSDPVREAAEQTKSSAAITALEKRAKAAEARVSDLRDEAKKLRDMVDTLAFEPLSGGVTSIDEALYVLGFGADEMPDSRDIRSRFRSLATIYHPDSGVGDHERMAQLNSAADILNRNLG